MIGQLEEQGVPVVMLDWSRFGATSQVGDLVSKIEPQSPHWSESAAVREFVYDEQRMNQHSTTRPSLNGPHAPVVETPTLCMSPVVAKKELLRSSSSPTGIENFDHSDFHEKKQQPEEVNSLRMGDLTVS